MSTGDFSRISFDPLNNVRTVMFLQGRPVTDADLNESCEAALRRIETEAIDIIGAQGAPLTGGGFRIVRDASQLAPAEAADPRNQFNAALLNLQNAPFLITAGRYYINGLQIENHRICGPLGLVPPSPPAPAPRFASQPLPLGADALSGHGSTLVFLRAVIDNQSAVEAPRLLDPALGDADTSSRAIVSWQVLLMDAPAGTNCESGDTDAWKGMVEASSGRLIVSLNAAAPSSDPCKLVPAGGYVRPENLLYRVQVHDGVPASAADVYADGPRFQRDGLKLKVSRNNGMEVARVQKVTGNTLLVTPGARDGLPTFRQGDWVEILKDGAEARGDAAAGWTQVLDVAGDVLTVASAAGAADGDRIRLWNFDILTAPANPNDPLPIEDGLEIKLPAGGKYRRGDYWLIAARYAVGPEYWGAIVDKPLAPQGPRIEYGRLAVAELNAGNVQSVADCRPTFEPLTQLLSFHYGGGDGQTVSPVGVAAGGFAQAPSALRAGVRIGRKPVSGARVRFDLLSQGAPATAGLIVRQGAGVGSAQGQSVIVETGVDGVASVNWSLNLNDGVQRVRAVLLDANDTANVAALPLPIEYSATLNQAAQVGYAPGACAGLAGIGDVQAALDKLCADLAKVTIPEPPLFVERVVASGSNLSIGNNESLSPDQLVEGIEVIFSEAIGTSVKGNEPILRVWIDFPFPADRSQRATWRTFLGLGTSASPIIGTIPLSLAGKIEVNAAGNGLHWRPEKNTQFLLKTAPAHKFGLQTMDEPLVSFADLPLKAYISVRGDCVWTRRNEPRRYLDGEVLAMQDANNLFAMEPKMLDRQLAADYRIWFYLVM